MKTRTLILTVLSVLLFFSVMSAAAETIYLTDGTVIRGKIIESTDQYIRVLVGKEGAQAETVIWREKILRIVQDEPEAEPAKTDKEADLQGMEKALAEAAEAVELKKAGNNDDFLTKLTSMMSRVQNEADFKTAYKVVEEALGKTMPQLLEEQFKIPCSKVIHPKPFFRICPTCKGEKTFERTVDGKKKKIKCGTCDAKGVVDCETCQKKLKLAETWRKRVRYTEEELKKIAWVTINLNGIKETSARPIITKILGKATVYETDKTNDVIKMEVTFKDETVEEFEQRLTSAGVQITKSVMAANTYIIKLNP